MIENATQFRVTLEKLGSLLSGLEDLQQSVLPKNPALYGVLTASVMEDIRRLRQELLDFSQADKVAG